MCGVDDKDVVTVEEIEKLLECLPEVQCARIVVNDWGAIEEVHVLASAERTPKQVVRDVESSLAARWGINIDHKKVSVAQLDSAKGRALPPRLKILHIGLTIDKATNRVETKVVLGRAPAPGDDKQGSAVGPASPPHTHRALARATLDAVNQMIQSDYKFLLDEVALFDMGMRSLAVVSVILLTPRGNEEALVGAAFDKGDTNTAMVKACLDAVNRRFGKVAIFPNA